MAPILAALTLVLLQVARAAVGGSEGGLLRSCRTDRVGYLGAQDGYASGVENIVRGYCGLGDEYPADLDRDTVSGEGEFSTVYKGTLPDGKIVAIKRAKKANFSALRDEFRNEVELLAKIEHRSLVRLLGFTDKGNERIIVAEYFPNGH
ncbi:hypothetical protein HPP92_021727 [Vanilla planifolia]|uniref:Protein kinase domain-containing protein n=1 Tax=Vanilla planifolia TaxID=51239 RepID=A0A835PZE3_VANPL|nr:hypothetical protein HPP92_021727 [Vanilla planifolia]